MIFSTFFTYKPVMPDNIKKSLSGFTTKQTQYEFLSIIISQR